MSNEEVFSVEDGVAAAGRYDGFGTQQGIFGDCPVFPGLGDAGFQNMFVELGLRIVDTVEPVAGIGYFLTLNQAHGGEQGGAAFLLLGAVQVSLVEVVYGGGHGLFAAHGEDAGLDIEVGIGGFGQHILQQAVGFFVAFGGDEVFYLQVLPHGGEVAAVGMAEEVFEHFGLAAGNQAQGGAGEGADVAVEAGEAAQGGVGIGGAAGVGGVDCIGNGGFGQAGEADGGLVHQAGGLRVGGFGVLEGKLGHTQEDVAHALAVGLGEDFGQAGTHRGNIAFGRSHNPAHTFLPGRRLGLGFLPALKHLLGQPHISGKSNFHSTLGYGRVFGALKQAVIRSEGCTALALLKDDFGREGDHQVVGTVEDLAAGKRGLRSGLARCGRGLGGQRQQEGGEREGADTEMP